MVEKLRWEFEALSRASTDREARVFCTLNCAWTAWHIHDWAWVAIENQPLLRTKMARTACVAPQRFDKDAFARWLAESHRDLDLCRIIATSAKHVGVEVGAREVDTTVSAVSNFAGTIDAVPDFDALDDFDLLRTTEWTPKIIVDGIRIPAIDLFERVLGFWTSFIWENQIDPD